MRIFAEGQRNFKNMQKRQRSIKYRLLDIECWQHYADSYPMRIKCPFEADLIVGESYDMKRYEEVEDLIREWFFKYQNQRVEIMNPLYQYGEKLETVMTIDILTNSKDLRHRSLDDNRSFFVGFSKLQKLLDLHQKRMNEILMFGGDTAMNRDNGVFLSNDVVMEDIEKSIQAVISQEKYRTLLLKMVSEGDEDATKALQWIRKDKKIIDELISMLGEKNASSVQQNLILRQLISCHEKLNVIQKRKITVISNDILRSATPIVRNKVLSVLSYFSSDTLSRLRDDCRKFIIEISKTKQLNCSYPASEIANILKKPPKYSNISGD